MSDFMLPDIGEGIVECEVVKWHVVEGDVIVEDQPVVEVMTDKALVEITAPVPGCITRLYVAEGKIAKVHAPLFAYEAESEGIGQKAAHPYATASKPISAPAIREASPRDFILPDIGEGIVECEVVEWHVTEGDSIEEDQPVVEVMTDKALVEITAPEAGLLHRLHVAQGEIARVHTPLFTYVPDDAGDEEAPDHNPAVEIPPGTTVVEKVVAPDEDVSTRQGGGPSGRIPAAPAVRRLLREHGLDLEQIPGSGRQGRVLKEDVLRILEADKQIAPVPSYSSDQPISPLLGSGAPHLTEDEVRVEPLRGVRAVMARRMVESATTIPHFQYSEEIDVTELLALREKLKPIAEHEGVRLTLMPFFMKAIALAIREEPILNARLSESADEIHYLSSVNIGMAVDSRTGLLVPNVKGVEHLSLLGIAAEVTRLTEAARAGKVPREDLKEGTISISNIGALGGTYAAPIINTPEVAIVAIGRTQWLPRFNSEERVVKRAIMTITWSGDHRIIDGATIARFCNAWRELLETPETILISH